MVLLALLHAHGLFDGDLVERIHAHLDVGQIDTGLVRLDAGLDVIVDHPFDGDENLHCAIHESAGMLGGGMVRRAPPVNVTPRQRTKTSASHSFGTLPCIASCP